MATPENPATAATALLRLAQADLANGDIQNAATRLLACRNQLADAQARRICAELLLAARCEPEAIDLAQRIATGHGDSWSWAWKFAGHLRARSDTHGSRNVLAALRDAQSDPVLRMRAELGIALGLPSAYSSSAELHAIRDEYAAGLAQFVSKYTPAVVRGLNVPPDALLWETFWLAYQGEDDLALQTQLGDWMSGCLAALLPEFSEAIRLPSRERPRLALVSSRFNQSTIGSYFASWVGYLAQQRWEVVLVRVGERRDALTDQLSGAAHADIALTGTVTENARRLRALDADIILYPEIGLDANVLALAALRLAPRQVCAWGHPVTTGLPTIDAFLSCAEMEPEQAQRHYRERLILLPGLGTRYLSPPIPARVPRGRLGLPEGRTLYLLPQVLLKFHPDLDQILVDIVRRDPAALFVVFEMRSPSPARRVRDRLLRALSAVSAEPQRHLHWFPECPREDYLRINLACDVMVDTLHWSGGNATLDALHCGLPVVTVEGPFMRGRQSAAMLRALGCSELIVDTPAELAAAAVAVARNPQRREAIAQRIRARLGEYTQSAAALTALDNALREMCKL